MQINPTKKAVNLHTLREGGVKTEDSIVERRGREGGKQGGCQRESASRAGSMGEGSMLCSGHLQESFCNRPLVYTNKRVIC